MHTLRFGLLEIAFALPILIFFFKIPNQSTELPYSANLQNQDRLSAVKLPNNKFTKAFARTRHWLTNSHPW
jgi:hypothetical protein